MRRRQQNVITVYLVLAVVVIVVLILALASGGGTTIKPVQQYLPVIPETTKVLGADTTRYLQSITPDGIFFTFSQSTLELASVMPGDVIVSDVTSLAPYGFLRRVVNVSSNGEQVIIETAPAALTDAIQDGTITLSKQLTPADVTGASQRNGMSFKNAAPAPLQDTFYFEIENVVIWDADGNTQTKSDQIRANGEFTLEPGFEFQLAIKNFELQQFRFVVEIKNTATLELEMGIQGEVDKSYELARYYLQPITVWVGFVPVVIVPVLTVNVGIDGEVNIGITTDLTRTETYKAGIAYDQNSWQTISEHTEKFEFTPPQLTAECDFKGYIGGQLSLLIYGTVGPYGNLKAYLELKADPFAVPWWEFFAGLQVDVGAKLEFLGLKIDKEFPAVIGYRIRLAQAQTPNSITPMVTVPPQTPPPESTTSTATALIFDVSGSMDEYDANGMMKLQAAQEAGADILNIIAAENQVQGGAVHHVAIVSFSNTAWVDLSLTTDVSAAQSALQGLYPMDRTGMPDGLKAGLDLLSGNPLNSKPIIILLTDGLPNVGLGGDMMADEATVRQQVLDLASQAGQQGICVYTVGFGDPYSGNIDEGFLGQVSANSGCGTYFNAQDANNLANVYVELRHLSTGDILLQKDGQISQSQQLDLGSVDVPQNQSILLYTLNWPGSRLDPILIDPSGQRVDASYPGASISTYSTLASIVIANPKPGTWQLAAFGADVPEGTTDFNALLSARPAPPTVVPTPPPPSGIPVAVLFLALVGGGVAIYVLSTRKGKTRPVARSGVAIGVVHLIGLSGEAAGRVVPLAEGFIIGRASTCHLRLADRSVSRQHAQLRYAQGRWYIQDMGSAGGTYLNGMRIEAAALNNGDRIRIGNSEMEFRA